MSQEVITGKTLFDLREEIEVQGLAVGPLDDNHVYICKHPEGFLYYSSDEGMTFTECDETLEELLSGEYDFRWKLHDAHKPIWDVLPDDLQEYVKKNHPRTRAELDLALMRRSTVDFTSKRSMKQMLNQAKRDRERIMHAAKIALVIQGTLVFTDDERKRLLQLLDGWLKDIVPSYAECLLEMEGPEEEE